MRSAAYKFEGIDCDDLHIKDYNTETDITITSGGSNQKNRDSHIILSMSDCLLFFFWFF